MDRNAHRAALHHHVAGNFVRGPDILNIKNSLVSRLLIGYPFDHACGVDIEVRLYPGFDIRKASPSPAKLSADNNAAAEYSTGSVPAMIPLYSSRLRS